MAADESQASSSAGQQRLIGKLSRSSVKAAISARACEPEVREPYVIIQVGSAQLTMPVSNVPALNTFLVELKTAITEARSRG